MSVIADEAIALDLARSRRSPHRLANQVHHVVLKDLEGLADGGDGLGPASSGSVLGVLEGVEDDVGADFALLTPCRSSPRVTFCRLAITSATVGLFRMEFGSSLRRTPEARPWPAGSVPLSLARARAWRWAMAWFCDFAKSMVLPRAARALRAVGLSAARLRRTLRDWRWSSRCW